MAHEKRSKTEKHAQVRYLEGVGDGSRQHEQVALAAVHRHTHRHKLAGRWEKRGKRTYGYKIQELSTN